jgi:sulfur carrier protein
VGNRGKNPFSEVWKERERGEKSYNFGKKVDNMVEITINGHKRKVKEGTTLAQLLRELKIEEKTMAVAVNMEIVKKEMWKNYTLQPGDRVEALHFVGGG